MARLLEPSARGGAQGAMRDAFRARLLADGSDERHRWDPAEAPAHHAQALDWLLDWIGQRVAGRRIAAVGHRVVHGGLHHSQPVLLDDEVIAGLTRLVPLAPLHQPHNLAGIAAARAAIGKVPQVACFDTAFHRSHGFVEDSFALPRALYDEGVRRYGFHARRCGADDRRLHGCRLAAPADRRVGGPRHARPDGGEMQVELVPQGTLAKRISSAGYGLGGVLVATGLRTLAAEGKPTLNIDGRTWLLEKPLSADFALIHARQADYAGNLAYQLTATNFNPVMACGRISGAGTGTEQRQTSAIGVDARHARWRLGRNAQRVWPARHPLRPLGERLLSGHVQGQGQRLWGVSVAVPTC